MLKKSKSFKLLLELTTVFQRGSNFQKWTRTNAPRYIVESCAKNYEGVEKFSAFIKEYHNDPTMILQSTISNDFEDLTTNSEDQWNQARAWPNNNLFQDKRHHARAYWQRRDARLLADLHPKTAALILSRCYRCRYDTESYKLAGRIVIKPN